MQACYPAANPVRAAVPTFEPVTREEAKAQLNIPQESDQHDAWVNEKIQECREQVERDAMLVCATGSYTFKRTDWGSRDWFEIPSSLRPVTAVSPITYVATDGTVTTWSSSEYSLDTYSIVPVVKLNYGYSWPTLRGDYSGISVTVTAGYSGPTAIPARIKNAVRLKLHEHWLLRMEMDASKQSEAYDNLVESLRREVYA